MKERVYLFFDSHPVIAWICIGLAIMVIGSISIVQKLLGMFYYVLFAGAFIYVAIGISKKNKPEE